MEFFAPAKSGEGIITEKRSRFIGRVFPAADENEAKQIIEQVKNENRDARHNPWCYNMPGEIARASDDGEPSGTSGPPMLEMLKKENILCAAVVVTRYFGGVLLGPGGLARAYTAAAKAAVEDAGLIRYITKTRVTLECQYPFLSKIKHEISSLKGIEENAEYAENIRISALFDPDKAEDFCEIINEITAGTVIPVIGSDTAIPAE